MIRALLLFGALGACTGQVDAPATPACPDLLVCPDPIQVTCTSPQTAAELPDAITCEPATVRDDRQATWPLGASTVTFEAEAGLLNVQTSARCSTTVTVLDEAPPIVACEPSVLLVRSAPGEAYPPPPVGTAEDACDPDNVTIRVSPTALTTVLTDVTTTATDGSGNEASCVTAAQVLDLFPVDGLRLLGARILGDGSTQATLGWEAPPTPDVEELEIQRAPAPAGPWTTIDAVDADVYTVAVELTEGAWFRVRSAGSGLTGGSSAALRVHAIATDAYNLKDQRVPRVPFATSLYGVVRHPADLGAGPFPLVVLLHGNHGNCRLVGTRDDYCGTLTTHECAFDGYTAAPNAEGMVFQAETLAAAGMVAVTLSANALNCRSVYIRERAELIVEHIRRWKAWNEGAPDPAGGRYFGAIDLSRIGLVGHSRGGDAVSTVPLVLQQTPVDGVDVASIFAIAPTDYEDATVFDASWAVLLPACDGDVSNLWGSDIYERSEVGVPHKAQVFMPGANHNYFSTEWDFDDGRRVCASRDLVGRPAQIAMLESTLVSFLSRTLAGDRPEAFHRAERAMPDPVSAYIPRTVDLRWAYARDRALILDDFRGTLGQNDAGGETVFAGFSATSSCFGDACGSSFLADTDAVRLTWGAGASPAVTCNLDGTDTSPYDALSVRVVSRRASENTGRSDQPVRLVVEDGARRRATLDLTEVIPVPHLYDGYDPREVLQTLRVPFATLEAANTDLDTSDIRRVVLELDGDAAGSVALTDLRMEE